MSTRNPFADDDIAGSEWDEAQWTELTRQGVRRRGLTAMKFALEDVDAGVSSKPFTIMDTGFKPWFPVIMFGQADAAPNLSWLVRGLLVDAGFSVIFGAPKSRKSFVALDMALAVAHGRDWFGCKVRQGGVVYVAGEGATGMRQRMRAWDQARDGDDEAAFALIPQAINLFDDLEAQDRLIFDIKGLGTKMRDPVRLVVLDTLSRMIGSGDEDKARDINALAAVAGRIQAETGANVMAVHHSGKDRDRGMRGSNALLGAADVVLEVTKDLKSGIGEVRIAAIKDGDDAIGPFAFNLTPVPLGTDEEGQPVTSCVIDSLGSAKGSQRRKLSAAERRCLAVLRELAGADQGVPGHWQSTALGTWRDTFRDREEGGFDARKKRAERAVKSLIELGFVAVRYEDAWLIEVEE